MQTVISIPDYLTDNFSLYLENMDSLADPENPDLLSNYLSSLFEQLKASPLIFEGMVDQLAMAISTKIKIDTENLTKLSLANEPAWSEVKPCIGVHNDARACITEIMTHAENDLKTAVLLIYFYNSYDAKPIKDNEADDTANEDSYSNDDSDYDENY